MINSETTIWELLNSELTEEKKAEINDYAKTKIEQHISEVNIEDGNDPQIL